jgi:hypothetical protein
MAPGLKFLSKKRPTDDGSTSSTKQKVSSKGNDDSNIGAAHSTSMEPVNPLPSPNELRKLSIADYINAAFGGDALVSLVSLADSRDEMVKSASAGFFPDVITGCVDVSMAIVEALLKFADSLDAEAQDSEEVMRARVKAFMLSVLDAVYGPNCVRIVVYNPDVDWNVSMWQLFPVPESPSTRSFLLQMPSQSETLIQWMDLKSRLMKQCRNPKREAQRIHKIAALEDELQELALRHSSLIERFIKIQQGEKDPEAAQALREAQAKRLTERKVKLKSIMKEKHQVVDPTTRSKRDAFLWGGQPHILATMAAVNNTTVSRMGSVGERVRRISRFGFRSEPDEDELDISSEPSSSEEEDPDKELAVPENDKKQKSPGCLAFLMCCKPSEKRRPSVI